MADKPQTLKVSDLSDFKSRNNKLLKAQVRSLANKLLGQYINRMLDEADDTLFSFSNKADSNQAQHVYLDAMREVRMKRHDIKSGFMESINSAFDIFEKKKSLPDTAHASILSDKDAMELIDNETLEVSMAIHNMADKQERQFPQERFAVKSRIKFLYNCTNPEVEIHPLSPITISNAFGTALTSFEIEFHVKLIIFKLFDKFVMSKLCNMYKEVNTLLVEGKILPNLNYSYKRSHSQYRPGASRNSRYPGLTGNESLNGHAWDTVDNIDGGTYQQHSSTDNYNAANRGSLLPTNFGLHGYTPSPRSSNDTISTLSAMQHFVSAEGYPENIKPIEIGRDIIDGIHKMGYPSIMGKPSLDEKTINMISMIFDFILDDTSIPRQIKGLLARLQIPYLKLALIDPTLIDSRSHPARQLLNDLTKASIGWSRKNNKNDLYERVESIVNTILNNYEHDSQLFKNLHQDFLIYWKQDQRVNLHYEARTSKTTEGKERIQFAKTRVDAWIHMWCLREGIRMQVSTFLKHFWKNTMFYCIHKFGEDSREWRYYVKIINALIWSTTPGKNKDDVKQLITITPLLIRGINQGLLAVSTHPKSISNIFREFSKCHVTIIEEAQANSTNDDDSSVTKNHKAGNSHEDHERTQETVNTLYQPSSEDDSDTPDLEVNATLESLADSIPCEVSEPEKNPENDAVQDDFFLQASAFECGQWLTFKKESVMAKLAWKSSITNKHLFVGRDGSRVSEMTLTELAEELRCGNANCVDKDAVFDRALDSVKKSL